MPHGMAYAFLAVNFPYLKFVFCFHDKDYKPQCVYVCCPLSRPLKVLNSSGLSTIHALNVVCASCKSLLRTFGVLLRNNRVKPTEFQSV